MKKEAVRRMKERGFASEFVERFEQEDAVVLAEDLWGQNRLIRENDELLQEIAEKLWEEEGALVYAAHLEHGHAFGQPVGNVWNLFCVGGDTSKWTQAAELQKDGFEVAYVIYPDHAGIERIQAREVSGTLIRVPGL